MTQDQSNWQEYLCDDLRPVMQYLQERHFITGWRVDHDLHQRGSRIYLNRNLSPKLIAGVKEQFANSPQIIFLPAEIRCATHQTRLLPRRMWYFGHGIKGQSPASFLLDVTVSFLFTIGGFFLVWNGSHEGDTRNILIGLGSILLFGLSFGLGIKDLIRYLRRK